MKAIVYRDFGSPDALRLEEIEKPVPADDEVLVAVRAAAVNMFDWYMVRGKPAVFRLLLGVGRRKPLGVDVAGVVEAVGRNVARFKPGDAVFGFATTAGMRPKGGSFAECAATSERTLAIKPPNITFAEAAGLPMAGVTALQGLRDHGRIQRGQKVLINGASGGIGTLAVQIARAFGAEVTGVCSASNADMVKRIGADHIVDYSREDFTADEQRYDVILDIVSNHDWKEIRRVLTANGRYVVVGGPPSRAIPTLMRAPFSDGKLVAFIARARADDLQVLADLIARGEITPVVDRLYRLEETSQAIRYVAAGHTRGKVIIAIHRANELQ
jgi:NADPH:quinone reductase-like Zn-dependent oxidoreductase